MSQRKLRKIAKNIKSQPKLKKVMATYLAENYGRLSNDEIKNILINGHRGFLAMSEKELTGLIDNEYDKLIKNNCSLVEIEKVYDEIFEGVFLTGDK